MQKEVWNYLDSGNGTPSFNMALDEALLNWHSEGEIRPTIRFYGWNPPTLSIGYFQTVDKEINIDAVGINNLGFVRRPTGGRAVLHDKELTYSVIVSELHPNMPQSVTESYRVISEGVLEGFKNLGLNAYFSVPATEHEVNELKRPRSAVCFDTPSWYELVVEDRKVVGSAQTRQKGVILQHGSILLDIDVELLYSLFKFNNERIKQRMMEYFKKKAVAINDLCKQPITIDQAKMAFKAGFEKGLGIKLEPYVLSNEQLLMVKEIENNKYLNDKWNYKK
ncbi:lipoate--protein ligase family protein [Calidifontibacillus oryziterrae]|uniref:lipoate--protein ligase family protein n=1 Tax=Calidifontibacillus oryziterrae TaxID=1191699 RepID=UPI0002EA3D35|nr:biotin/lipoate A/B protein ligase family protein [Calidifontibacillus oryziterrae]